MAKLKCDRHKLRVFTLNGKFMHRTGFGGVCDSPTATIGENTYTVKEIEASGDNGVPKKLRRIIDG